MSRSECARDAPQELLLPASGPSPSASHRAAASLADRLHRLRAQAGAPPAAASTAMPPELRRTTSGPSPMRLPTPPAERDRLRALLARRPGGATGMPRTPQGTDRRLPGTLIAPGLRYVEHWIPCPGPALFEPTWCETEAVAPGDLLCFDTETTGLAGGCGTRAFMIGASDWRQGGLRRRQLYMETLGAEPAMLAEFAQWLAPGQVLVSYNGRCYDAPLLATRYRLARQHNPLAGLRHLDLLTPVRRRFRGVWENCRLATVERELLGVQRSDDLPGSQAPAAWLEYLRGGSAERLRRVLAHNAQDLDSLARLLLALQAHATAP
jgi:uncharacterized protein